jgi:hypothetical protein
MRPTFRPPLHRVTELGEEVKPVTQPDRKQTEDRLPHQWIVIREQRAEILFGVTGRFVQNRTLSQAGAVRGDDA